MKLRQHKHAVLRIIERNPKAHPATSMFWRPYHRYGRVTLMVGEVGRYESFRFIVSPLV